MGFKTLFHVVTALVLVASTFAEYGVNYPREAMAFPQWMSLHKKYVTEMERHVKAGGLDLLFVGDSITESWRGLEYGQKAIRANGCDKIFKREYGHLKADALGIAGDQTPHLLWRLKNGELPPELQVKVVVVLIGTNDVSVKKEQADVVLGTQAIVDHIHTTHPATKVVVTAMFPRGETKHPRDPNPLLENITAINEGVQEMWGERDGVTVVNCNKDFLDKSENVINRHLMPDFLHLSWEGHEQWAKCIKPALEDFGVKLPKEHRRDEL